MRSRGETPIAASYAANKIITPGFVLQKTKPGDFSHFVDTV